MVAVSDHDPIVRHLRVVDRRLSTLEYRVSAVDDVITELNDATDEVAADLQRLRDEVAGGDQATADKFQPLIDRLTAMGQDPQNPVPDQPPAEPTPV